jgi:hypothetical protein
MTFLNPAILFGLFAASIPILIHLLNLRKLKKIDFSTLNFLKELQKNRIRKIKLKQWLLLALRVLTILLLVFAFARPTLEGTAIGGTTSAAKTTAVFILDDTFSMSVIDGEGSYLNQAKQDLQALLRNLQEGDDAALILVSEKMGTEIKPTQNISELSAKVDDVEASYSSGILHNAVTRAAQILSESKNFNKEIYLFSDFQKGRMFETGSLSDLSQLLDDRVKIYSFNYSGKDVYNIGIEEIKSETQIFEKDKPVSFRVTITNYSSSPVNNLVVSLFINNERTAQQSISLEAGGSVVISMESLIKQTGFVEVFAEIEDDEINFDNRRYTTIFIPDKIPVIIFYDEETDTRFVGLALLSSGSEATFVITKRNLNQFASINLNQYEAVVVIGSERIASSERLLRYVENGGGLLLMPGSKSSTDNFQNVLNTLKLPAVKGAFGSVNQTANVVNFDKVDFNHPIFKDIFTKDAKRNVESPDIYHHYNLTTEGRGTNIISLMNGSSFLSEFKIGNGKVFLLGISPVLSWSNLPIKGIFPPLMNKSIFYLASRNQSDEEHFAGDAVDLNVAVSVRHSGLPQLTIERPDGTEEFINLEERNFANYIVYSETDLTGVYKVISGTNQIDNFSVNHNPLESVAQYEYDKFKNYLEEINFKGSYFSISKDADPIQIVLQTRFGSELWKLFLLAALVTALIEMMVARNVKKELVEVAS